MSAPVTWLEPWYPVDEFGAERAVEMAAALEKQLRREICERHVLHGESVRLIARRADTDDALFALDRRPRRRGAPDLAAGHRARSPLARHAPYSPRWINGCAKAWSRCMNG